MVDRNVSFFKKTVSGDIDVSICYDGVLIVDGVEVCNIMDFPKSINGKLLDLIDGFHD